ncbi:multidrug RND transporter [bacterium I07]|nr:multidrug RND transporter [bacterium I07]
MRDLLLKKLARLHALHPVRMGLLIMLLTFIMAFFASRISQTMRWSDLLPSNDRRTIQYNKIVEEFVTATSIVVVVQGDEREITGYAEKLVPMMMNARDKDTPYKPLIQRVDYKLETEFLQNHGLMLLKEEDLVNIKELFTDPNLDQMLKNLNNALEKEYVGKGESISTREKEDQAVKMLDGIESLILLFKQALKGQLDEISVKMSADHLLIGDPYVRSYEKKTLILNAVPNFTMTDARLLIEGVEEIQSILNDLKQEYPEVEAGLTGMIPIGHDEMVYAEKSLGYTTLIALMAIFILLVFSLRMWAAPVLAIVNLIVGIIWAIGATAILVGQLNIMTSMMAVILLGLGIDFAIHLISGFTEWRAAGAGIQDAMERTFLHSGKGVITGGLTTACAFLTLVISSSRGMKEMGLVTGIGLIAILVNTFLCLPVLLVVREKIENRRHGNETSTLMTKDLSFRNLGRTGLWLSRHHKLTLCVAVIVTMFMIWQSSHITFDHNYMNIEPEGLTSIALQDTVLDHFDLSMDYALILTDNPDESGKLSAKCRKMNTVAMTDDISLYLPSREEQLKRVVHVKSVHQQMKKTIVKNVLHAGDWAAMRAELDRLQSNVMEIQDMAYLGGQDRVDRKCQRLVGDPDNEQKSGIIFELFESDHYQSSMAAGRMSDLNRYWAPYYRDRVLGMSNSEMIDFDDLPPSILDRYSNAARDQFLVTVFPSGNIWQDSEFLKMFVEDLESASDRATGMPPVFRALIEIIGRDGQNALILTLLLVFILLWIDFKNPRLALLAMLPLAAGLFWMVGLMHLFGQQFTVMNVMGLPMILGIGIDDGVHIVHRWISEGKGRIKTVFSSTGKAILLTSLTTMLAFGSLTFSVWRGFAHLGTALFLGVGACFLTTVLFLAGIMGLSEKRNLNPDKNSVA